MTGVMYPVELIEQIKAYWSTHDEQYRLPPLPDDNDLRELLDVAFLAGLTREEDRPVRLCLAWCSRDEAITPNRENSSVICLSNPVPLTVENVRRLAVAVDYRSVVLAVTKPAIVDTAQAPELSIWGLIYIGEPWARMVEGWQDSGGPGPPSSLLVTCPDAGSIFITWRGLPVAKLHLGALVQRGDEIFRLAPFEALINSAIEELYRATYGPRPCTVDETVAQRWTSIWHAYTRCISWLLLGIEQLHHGGAVIFIHERDHDQVLHPDILRVKYAVEDWGLWSTLLQYCEWSRETDASLGNSSYRSPLLKNPADAIHLRDATGRTMGEFIALIAQLSATDGAILLTDRLRLLGFGAEIRCHAPIESIEVVKRWPEDIIGKQPAESFGTRHRSAFRFCHMLDQSAVFVVSQDGGVRAVRKWGKKILLWPNVRIGRGL